MRSYLDDSGYEKLISTSTHVFMFAGDAVVIEQWKCAIKQATSGGLAPTWDRLPVNGMAISIAAHPSGVVIFEIGHDITDQHVSFAGTGSYAAATCWIKNKNAVKAVETAKSTDTFTGGEVRYFNTYTGDNNLVVDIDLGSLVRKFTGEATMKYDSTTQAPHFGEALGGGAIAANDEAKIQAMLDSFAAGHGPTAPCDAVFKVWAPEKREQLVTAMQNIFG